jgi:glucose/arabinose dehydrogenase
MGDGGSGNDPNNRAQDSTQLLGKMLRINVDNVVPPATYSIPSDNPFVAFGPNVRKEIWALGMRNPWRWSFDAVSGELWVGDVGQNDWEEVDLIEKGKNYGWRIMEGFNCNPNIGGCNPTGLTPPIKEYSHSLGFSVTGGYVYRGYRRPELYGAYVYADYGSGRIWKLRYINGMITEDSLLYDAPYSISSFGEDQDHELYIVRYSGSPGSTER